MADVTISELLECGVYFGHQTQRWNPKMKPYILTAKDSMYIIDLRKTIVQLQKAKDYIKNVVSDGGRVLFVGTKKQAQSAIVEHANRARMPYVNHRWLGGMLTNYNTVTSRLGTLKELEEINYESTSSNRTKKELLLLSRQRDKLEKMLGGIKSMRRLPALLWVVDTNKEHLAIKEAKRLGIPVISILDTNCDPDEVTIGIPGNDDSIRSIDLITKLIADAVIEGRALFEQKKAEVRENKAKDNQETNQENTDPQVDNKEKTVISGENNEKSSKMSVSVDDIKKLRDLTGAGMLDVKNALKEADGDQEKAIEIIRLKGLKSLSKREGRKTNAGIVAGRINADKTQGYLIELDSETDFVAKNEKFTTLAQEILDIALEVKPSNLTELLGAKTKDQTVEDLVNSLSAVVGEKITLSKYAKLDSAYVELYLHQTSSDLPAQIGVLVSGSKKISDVAKSLGMHIAAFSPRWISVDDIPAEELEKEKETLRKITLQEGKPENIVDKIVLGRLNSFYQQNCLLNQDYAKDPSITVGKLLEKSEASLDSFLRFKVGEEI